MTNEEYRELPGLSATFLKNCLRSVAHAMTPKKQTKSMQTGLRLHEFILERDKFLSQYKQGLNPDDYHDALRSADDLRAAINEINETRKPMLKTTGSVAALLESIIQDDPEHMKGVQDASSLSKQDLINRINFINSAPDRGLLSTSGTIPALAERLRDAGYKGQIWYDLLLEHDKDERETISFDEYANYEGMYNSLLSYLEAADDSETVLKWLLYGLTTPGAMETEVTVVANGSKCRLDGLIKSDGFRLGIELKTTQDASQDGFGRQAARLHYDLQHNHYTTVCADDGKPLTAMPFIAIEPEPPYAVNVFIPSEEFIDSGRKKREYAIRKYEEYKSAKVKTAFKPVAKTLELPAWAAYGEWNDE